MYNVAHYTVDNSNILFYHVKCVAPFLKRNCFKDLHHLYVIFCIEFFSNETTCPKYMEDITKMRCYLKYDSMGKLISRVHEPLKSIQNCKNDFNCSKGYYKCRSVNYCIPIQLVCDDIPHCKEQDDEIECSKHINIIKKS